MEGETTRNVERRESSWEKRFVRFLRSAVQASSGSQPEGRRFKSCPRYEENPWNTYIPEGFLAFEIVEVALHTASIPRAVKFAALPGPVRGVGSSPGTGVDDGLGMPT